MRLAAANNLAIRAGPSEADRAPIAGLTGNTKQAAPCTKKMRQDVSILPHAFEQH
jgi:hypothetical protein